MGLASIYKKYSLQGEGGRDASKQISWIKDKLLHIYYQNSIDDRWVPESPPGGVGEGPGPHVWSDWDWKRSTRPMCAAHIAYNKMVYPTKCID